jgi:hypothetical protein
MSVGNWLSVPASIFNDHPGWGGAIVLVSLLAFVLVRYAPHMADIIKALKGGLP